MDKKKALDTAAKLGLLGVAGSTAYNLFSACLIKRREQNGEFAAAFPEIEDEINEVIARERAKKGVDINE